MFRFFKTLIVATYAFKNARNHRQSATLFLCSMLFVLTMATALQGTSKWFALGNGNQKAAMHGTLPSYDALTNKELAPKKMYQEE